MIRFLLRFFGVLLLAAAFVLVVHDGAKSIADNQMRIYSLGRLWGDIHGASLQSFRMLGETALFDWLWHPVLQTLLDLPAGLILGAGAIVLILLGRKKKPLIGYARE